MASTNADAVRFPKGVFPPDADFGKGEHVPATHDGSGGVQRGRTVGSAPLGRLFWYFSARGRKVQLEHVPPTLWRQPAKVKELIFQKSLPADVMARLSKDKELTLHTGICQYASPRPARPPRPKNLFIKKAVPAGHPRENRKKHLNQHTGICNTPKVSRETIAP